MRLNIENGRRGESESSLDERPIFQTSAQTLNDPSSPRGSNDPSNIPATDTPSSICKSVDFLRKFGIAEHTLRRAAQLAIENGTIAAQELIAFNGIAEITYYEHMAAHLGIRLIREDDVEDIAVSSRNAALSLNTSSVVRGRLKGAGFTPILAPDPRQFSTVEKMAARDGARDGARAAFVLTAPSILRTILQREYGEVLLKRATNFLATDKPAWSAKFGARAWQGAFFAFLLMLSAALFFVDPGIFALGLHLLVSVFFFICVSLRLLAMLAFRRSPIKPIERTSNAEKPVYSVVVALHDEAAVVPDLVTTLKALKWPRSKLEIKLICEADDAATMAALAAQNLDSRFEIVRVPHGEPRTKPRALCYALAFVSGTYLTVYDAEDRPHPEQLLEAYAAFKKGGQNLACVQAPLRAANPMRSLWTAMFHFEYAGLFGGLLPWLARRQAPILLGGTSNHFNRAMLIDVGAWDPFNVTEDADLGLRLWRQGYRTDMISRPTLEDAPLNFETWLPQRTRWFKGWMQTWIVHMRKPGELWSRMSLGSFIITQALLTGTIVSALLHPLMLAKAILLLAAIIHNPHAAWLTPMAVLDWSIIALSYIGFMALCWRAAEPSVRHKIGVKILLTPLYWVTISIAAWRALYQLIKRPFHWEKTPHFAHEKDIQQGL